MLLKRDRCSCCGKEMVQIPYIVPRENSNIPRRVHACRSCDGYELWPRYNRKDTTA